MDTVNLKGEECNGSWQGLNTKRFWEIINKGL